MPAETVDALELNIKTRADQAKKKLDGLATSIDTFGEKVSKYAGDLTTFGDALEKIAKAATDLSKVRNLGNLIRSATSANARLKDATGKAAEAKAASKIAKESNSAWKQYDEWNKQQNRDYAKSHKLNWGEVKRNSDLYSKRTALPDYTNQEIAAWKAGEDRSMLPYWKNRAEGIVADRSVQPKGWKDVIEEANGIGREFKSAEESAKVIEQALASEADRVKASVTGMEEYEQRRAGVIKSFDDYQGKDWRRENAEDTDYFNQQLGKIASDPGALKGIYTSIHQLAEAGTEGRLMQKAIAESKEEAAGLEANVRQTADDFMQSISQADLLQMKLDGVKQQLEEAINSDNYDESKIARLAAQYDKLKDQIKKVGDAAKDTVKQTSGLKDFLGEIGSAISKSFIGKLGSQLFRIAKLRLLRETVKSLFGDINEGISNLYQWSKGIGGHFAGALDNIATKALYARNSIATAFAPAIEALVPAISTVVSWINAACNAFAQFIALLTGKASWSKATETAQEWGAAAKSAGKSAKSAEKDMKDLLADWDELNIIQSKASDGSGGGGGGGKAAPKYSDMFEEVYEFDERIKDAFSFINEYMGGIKQLAIDIGAAILGWTLSSNFTGWLGKLGSLLVGVSALKIGIELGYGTGFEAGKKGKFDGKDILKTIGAAIAAGIGGWFILGPTGLVLGITAELGVELVGYLRGRNDAEDAFKWGSNTLSPDEINEYVSRQFKFDVRADIEILESVIGNQEEARRMLNERISDFSASLDQIRVGVDGTPEGISAAGEKAAAVIDEINAYIKTNKKTLEVLTQINPIMDASGNNQSESFLGNLNVADTALVTYFQNLGKDIAKWIDEGEKAGWKNNEAQMALELMAHQENIVNQAEQNKLLREFQVDSELNLSGMTRDSAESVLNRQTELLDSYKEKMKTAYANQVKDLLFKADLADAAGLKDEAGNPLSKVYLDSANTLLQQIENGEIYQKLEESASAMRDVWIEQLKKVYGGDITDSVGLATQMTDVFRQWFGYGSYFQDELYKQFLGGDAEGAGQYLSDELSKILDSIDPHGIVRKAASEFGFSIFDLMSVDDKLSLADTVKEAVRGDENAAKEILKAAGMDGQSIALAFKEDLIEETETFSSAKEAIIDAMEDADWQHMPDTEFIELLNTLKTMFGESNVREALKDFDIPAVDLGGFNTDQSVTIDAATSGMALDSTMTNVGSSMQASASAMEGLLGQLLSKMGEQITATNNVANRPVNVNISPSALLGDLFGRSNRAYETASGEG